MIRIIISLFEKDKQGLDQYSRKHHQPTVQTIRMAIKRFRELAREERATIDIDQSAGLWKNRSKQKDGLKYVCDLRKERNIVSF